jgi:hypothetical protein
MKSIAVYPGVAITLQSVWSNAEISDTIWNYMRTPSRAGRECYLQLRDVEAFVHSSSAHSGLNSIAIQVYRAD